MCWPINPVPAKTKNVSWYVLTKISHASEDMELKSICVALKLFYASENSKYISTCVVKTPPMPASKQNVPYHVLTKLNP